MDEVCSWGQSFDKLMRCPAGRCAFRQFLRTEFSEENMLFWLACEEFNKETNKSVIKEKARLIYEDYISILSPKEVCAFVWVSDYVLSELRSTGRHRPFRLSKWNTSSTISAFKPWLKDYNMES